MIFTFGFGHSCTCGRSLRECYVEIVEPDYDAARAIMVERYGKKWAFQYETLADATGGPPRVTVPCCELRRVEPSDECGCGGLGRDPWEPELSAERRAELERLAGVFVEEHFGEREIRGGGPIVVVPDLGSTLNNLAASVDELTREHLGKPLAVMIVGTAADGFMVASTLDEADFARELRALLDRVEAELAGLPPVVGKPHTA